MYRILLEKRNIWLVAQLFKSIIQRRINWTHILLYISNGIINIRRLISDKDSYMIDLDLCTFEFGCSAKYSTNKNRRLLVQKK